VKRLKSKSIAMAEGELYDEAKLRNDDHLRA
jgi:hypothetical protein